MSQEISPNVWYYVTSQATDYYLSYDPSPGSNGLSPLILSQGPQSWQFLDTGVASGGDASNVYLIRPEGFSENCVQGSDAPPSLIDCSATTDVWTVVFDSDAGATTVYNSSLGYLAAECASCDTVQTLDDPNSLEYQANIAFSLESVSEINDPASSTLPYPAPTTTDEPTTTSDVESTSTTTEDSSTSTDDSTTTTTDEPSSTTTETVSQGTSTAFATSIIKKSLADLPEPASLLIPEHTNIGCENCSVAGNLDIAVIGYGASSDTLDNVEQFADQGAIDITISAMDAEIALDIELLPGFKAMDAFLDFLDFDSSIRISDELTVNLRFEFGIPLIIELDSTVTFTGGFRFSVDQGTLHIDLSSIDDSSAMGFDQGRFELLPFHVSAPDLAFSVIMGLAVRVTAEIVLEGDDFGTSGALTITNYFPRLNTTASVKANVDDTCNPPNGGRTHDRALQLQVDADVAVTGDGEINLLYRSTSISDIEGSAFPPLSYFLDSEGLCLFDDSLKAEFLSIAAQTHHVMPQWSMLSLVFAAGWWVVNM